MKLSRVRLRAITRVEVFVTGAFVCLLATFLATGMTENRERAERARCLANLRQLAAGAQAYAAEDSLNQVVPLHASMVRTAVNTTGWSDEWSWRTAARFAFGGQTATAPFAQSRTLPPANFTSVVVNPDGAWGAATRPLNRYVTASIDNTRLEDLQAFRCPADQGYPDNAFTSNREISRGATATPCIGVLGNSYCFRNMGLIWGTVGSPNVMGRFSSGVLGHRLSTLVDTSRLVLFSDAPFSTMARSIRPSSHEAVPFLGWHGQEWADNAAYVDGSARLTLNGNLLNPWDFTTLQEMGYTDPTGGFDPTWFLSRGRAWRNDTYPTPGARIAVRNAAGTIVTPPISYFGPPWINHWPFLNYQDVTP